MELFGGTIKTLEGSLDYASAKNRTIANNISNVDTPDYKAKDVEFKNVLNEALDPSFDTKRTHAKHIPFDNASQGQPFRVVTRQNTKEMTDLAKNQIYYQSLVDRMNGKFGSLQSVIRGGQ